MATVVNGSGPTTACSSTPTTTTTTTTSSSEPNGSEERRTSHSSELAVHLKEPPAGGRRSPRTTPEPTGADGNISTAGTQPMETCFSSFDRDGDGFLNYAEFVVLCRALFRNERDKPYHVEPKRLRDMFDTFDINKDGLIDINEFELCWQKWIRKIVRPVCALIVVDVQNDFISGSLAISNCPAKHNGEEVVEPINHLLDTVEFDCVCYTLDWHPDNHISFVDNISLRQLDTSSPIQNPEEVKLYDTVVFQSPYGSLEQRMWPRHCVQNSWGAKIHENIKIIEGSPFIYKGTNPEMDSYSAFFDNKKLAKTVLDEELMSRGVTDVFVCGLAYDVCVAYTALNAIELGYRTILLEDASRGIDLADIVTMNKRIEDGHGIIATSHQVKAMSQGRDRRPELGYKLAMELRQQIKQLEQENRI